MPEEFVQNLVYRRMRADTPKKTARGIELRAAGPTPREWERRSYDKVPARHEAQRHYHMHFGAEEMFFDPERSSGLPERTRRRGGSGRLRLLPEGPRGAQHVRATQREEPARYPRDQRRGSFAATSSPDDRDHGYRMGGLGALISIRDAPSARGSSASCSRQGDARRGETRPILELDRPGTGDAAARLRVRGHERRARDRPIIRALRGLVLSIMLLFAGLLPISARCAKRPGDFIAEGRQKYAEEVGREGFEPSTLGLRVPCSTN